MGEEQHTTVSEVWSELANRHCRTLDEVLDDMPLAVEEVHDPFQSRRHLGIAHVVCSIPPGDYQRLTSLVLSFHWFVPDYQTYGEIQSFPITGEEAGPFGGDHSKVLYLSPRLECAAWDITVAAVAHELAHIVLGHSVSPHRDEYDAQEATAWLRVCDWGFEREAKKHKALCKRRASLERRTMERLCQ